MTILEELSFHTNWQDGLENEILTNIYKLLSKGYSPTQDYDEILALADNVDDIPNTNHDEILDKIIGMMDDITELTKKNERIGIFLRDGDDFTAFDGYNELEKMTKGDEYDNGKIHLWDPIKEFSLPYVYKLINNE